MRICLAFSAGGHHFEMRRLMDAFKGNEVFFVTTKKVCTENLEKVWYIKDTMGSTRLNMFLNMSIVAAQSLRILLLEHPRLIVSTGADVTIPICYLGKVMGLKIVFVESIARVIDLSFSGKIVYPIADLFLVQWPQLKARYKKAKYWGQVV